MHRPGSIAELLDLVRSRNRVLAVGARTKPLLSQTSDDTEAIEMTSISGITEYDPAEFTVTAFAGTPALEVETALAAEGQFLPFAPMLRGSGATLGGTVASGMGGPGRFRFGGVRDFILGIRFVDGFGRLISGGGKVVKNSAGFDLPKLMVGSIGRLGILTEVTFKVFPAPASILSLRAPCADAREAMEKLVFAASSRWELQAIDYAPYEKALVLRIGGPDISNRAIAAEITSLWGPGPIETLSPDESESLWKSVRELDWAADFEASVVVKVPITPREISPLEEALSSLPGARAHYSVGGNVALIALRERKDAGTLDRVLRQLELRGMAFAGEGVPVWYGEQPQFEIFRAVKEALDPDYRFPQF